MKLRILLPLVACLGLHTAQAAEISVDFTQLVGPAWKATFLVTNNGTPAEIAGFTVYFDHSTFTDLASIAVPAGWDSIVVQPDDAIPAAGYLDSFALDGQPTLAAGGKMGGWQVGFTLLVPNAPPMLQFDIVDAGFQVLESGVTTPVPEPATWLLAAAGAALLRRRLRTAD